MKIGEKRRERLRKWVTDHKISNKHLHEITGKSPAYLSDILNGKKSFGEDAARMFEKKLKMPFLFLDLPEGCVIVTDPDQIEILQKCVKLPPEFMGHLKQEVDSLITLSADTRKKGNGE